MSAGRATHLAFVKTSWIQPVEELVKVLDTADF